ncbi:MAG: zinc ABC transporter substrate-binding protein [Rikenellaceae bacterium]
MNIYIRSIYIATLLFFTGCQSVTPVEESSTIYISIAPLRSIVERITCNDFPVEVVVPSGASVESYEPTPKQFIALNQAQMIFSTGLLGFEESIIKRVSRRDKIFDLSQGIEVIAGSCSHTHHHANHSHGVDPHIWTSPKELLQMADNCYGAISKKYPDSLKYREAYTLLSDELRRLDAECKEKIESSGISSIFIYHPALTYYARTYGIEQVAIESEGKEPSAKRLAEMIERGRQESIKSILYQVQYQVSCVEIVAEDLNAYSVEIDPLNEDIISQIKYITTIITTGL